MAIRFRLAFAAQQQKLETREIFKSSKYWDWGLGSSLLLASLSLHYHITITKLSRLRNWIRLSLDFGASPILTNGVLPY